MESSENPIGFSTGAISKGAFRDALEILRSHPEKPVEISALRREEMCELAASFGSLDLSAFHYVSVHAPSRIDAAEEAQVVQEIASLPDRCRWIITHPDVIGNCSLWRKIEHRLAIENMDTRKSTGRTAAEMKGIFEKLPNAKMCLDLAHCEKVDSTMFEAQELIRQFGSRIVQVHVSEIATDSSHHRLTMQGIWAIRRVAKLIPVKVPVILESPVEAAEIESEIERARNLFQPMPALAGLKVDIDAVLHGTEHLRADSARTFLSMLKRLGIQFGDAANGIAQLPHGGPATRGQVFLTTRDLYNSLTADERSAVDAYYEKQVREILVQLPDLATSESPWPASRPVQAS